MSIISKYLLRLHFVPFVFALSALTGIMLVNQIARRFPDLVGKGLPWTVIGEVFALSIPFLLAMTLPMAVLVAVLYTMSRLTADNELTALRAGGISVATVSRTLLLGGAVIAAVTFLFSDQILPRSNHRLRALLTDISRTKPTFALEEQVINEVKRNNLFLRAGTVDPATYTLRDVTIFDLSNHNRRRVTYADSAYMAFDESLEDLYLTLFDGTMHESDRTKRESFQIVEFTKDIVRVDDVSGNFSRTLNDGFKGDREMSVCEMDSVVAAARREIGSADQRAAVIETNNLRGLVGLAPLPSASAVPPPPRPLYCRALDRVLAAVSPPVARAEPIDGETPQAASGQAERFRNRLAQQTATALEDTLSVSAAAVPPRLNSAIVLRDRVRSARIREANYLVEVHKKYAIAVACIVFVLVGIPAAIRFPRGGVGLVIGLSLVVFGVFYVGLIGGESLANKLIVPPFGAMWAPNIIFAIIGSIGLWRVANQSTAVRGGGLSLAGWLPWRRRRRAS